MKNLKKCVAVLLAAAMLLAFGDSQVQAAQQASAASAAGGLFSSFFRSFGKSKPKETKKQGLTVVLDAGHGGTDYGAVGNRLQEKALTLKLALYCKAELEKYDGAEVYLTRSEDQYIGLDQRIKLASGADADVFVSLHINSDVTKEAYGAEVYYPNSNYRPSVGKEGKRLAGAIQKNLAALGLYDRGIKTLNSMAGTTYPDGTQSDYYAVIRGAKQAGYPGIIVEHAFISSAGDAKEFLSTDAALKKLAAADAKGIAACYGLNRVDASDTLRKTSLTKLVGRSSSRVFLEWEQVESASGYEVYRSTSQKGEYKRVARIKQSGNTTCADRDVESGQTYYYKVRPYKISGDQKETAGFCTAQKVKLLKAPSVLVQNQGVRTRISWKSIKGADKYEIYRSTTENGNYQKIAAVEEMTSFMDSTCKPGVVYFYKMRAVCNGIQGSTCSSYSKIKQSMMGK